MNSISFGQFYPSNSFIHKLDPRVKIIVAIAYIVASFLCTNIASFGLLLASAILLILLARIPLRIIFKSLKAIIFIMAFTAVLNVFLTSTPDSKPIFSWWIINIYEAGLYNAAFIVVRIIAMIIGTSVFLTYTTTPIQLTDAIEQLLAPLKLFRLPVHEFAMMMTIALRFIPTIIEETEKIMAAQKARGADFTTGSPVKRVKALIPIIIPLFISAFRRAGELATAMTCRCYRGGKGRTKLNRLKIGYRDVMIVIAAVLFIIGIILLNQLNLGYSM